MNIIEFNFGPKLNFLFSFLCDPEHQTPTFTSVLPVFIFFEEWFHKECALSSWEILPYFSTYSPAYPLIFLLRILSGQSILYYCESWWWNFIGPRLRDWSIKQMQVSKMWNTSLSFLFFRRFRRFFFLSVCAVKHIWVVFVGIPLWKKCVLMDSIDILVKHLNLVRDLSQKLVKISFIM